MADDEITASTDDDFAAFFQMVKDLRQSGDENGPPVNPKVLLAYVNGALDMNRCRVITRLTKYCAPWTDAYNKIVDERRQEDKRKEISQTSADWIKSLVNEPTDPQVIREIFAQMPPFPEFQGTVAASKTVGELYETVNKCMKNDGTRWLAIAFNHELMNGYPDYRAYSRAAKGEPLPNH